MQPTWIMANGWREIILRAFHSFKRMENYSPEWLINPETRRHLKLDYYFPEINIAVRLEGVKAKERKSRLSLEEEEQERIRNEARVTQCEKNGIALIVIDVLADEPKAVFKNFEIKLSWATRMALQAASPDEQKVDLESRLRNCRSLLHDISWKVRQQEDLDIYAELWTDRHYAIPVPEEKPEQAKTAAVNFRKGMRVNHASYGEGVVTGLRHEGNDDFVTVDFVLKGERTFITRLVAEKLTPI